MTKPNPDANLAVPIDWLIENVAWLIGTDTVASITARVGYDNPATLCRRLARHGRPDLARHFEPRDTA